MELSAGDFVRRSQKGVGVACDELRPCAGLGVSDEELATQMHPLNGYAPRAVADFACSEARVRKKPSLCPNVWLFGGWGRHKSFLTLGRDLNR